jgi:hypothetical protein
MVRFGGDKAKADAVYAGCEPLTPDDIAEVVVFAAGRRENVVLADSLIFPNHQVSRNAAFFSLLESPADLGNFSRPPPLSCTESRNEASKVC